MVDDVREDDMFVRSDDEEVPFVEIPRSRRLEDWVAVAPRSIASRFSMHPNEAFSIVADLDWGMTLAWGAFTP